MEFYDIKVGETYQFTNLDVPQADIFPSGLVTIELATDELNIMGKYVTPSSLAHLGKFFIRPSELSPVEYVKKFTYTEFRPHWVGK